MKSITRIITISFVLILLPVFNLNAGENSTPLNSGKEGKILALIDMLTENVIDELQELDISVNRIAIYHIKMDQHVFSASMSRLLEGKLQNIFQAVEGITLVTLPKINGIKISSTDSTFQVINTVPSVEELWKLGRKLRIQAFLDGECSYRPYRL